MGVYRTFNHKELEQFKHFNKQSEPESAKVFGLQITGTDQTQNRGTFMNENNRNPDQASGRVQKCPGGTTTPESDAGVEGLRPGMKCSIGSDPAKERAIAGCESGDRERGHWDWLVLGGIAIAGLLGLAVIVTMVVRNADHRAAVGKSRIGQTEAFNPGDPNEWKGPLPAEIAERFTKATTNVERLKLVRNPELTAPLMEDFFLNGPGARERILGIARLEPASNGKVSFQRFQVRLEDETNRLLCVVLTDDGGKVDFECYARHGSATWKDLLEGVAPSAGEVRVFVSRGSYYAYGFQDEPTWSSFVASTPDWDVPLYFYARRDSKVDKELRKLTAAGQMRATLAIRSVEGSCRQKQFEITEVLAGGWVR